MTIKKIILTLTCAIILSACDKPTTLPTTAEDPAYVHPTGEVQSDPPFSEAITLTDKAGRSLTVRILARDADEISFIRLSDAKPFRWKIDSLSASDQKRLKLLPISSLDQSTSEMTGQVLYVLNRQKDIDRFESEIKSLEKELETILLKASKGISPRAKGVQTLIEQKRAKVLVLQKEIDSYRPD